MFNSKEYIDHREGIQPAEIEGIPNSKVIMREGGIGMNRTEKLDVAPAVYELKEDGATYGVGYEMLRRIQNFFKLFMKSKNNPFPTLLLWYKGLSRDEKKTVMIISKERTENDSFSEKKPLE